jgi:hypothetical protein
MNNAPAPIRALSCTSLKCCYGYNTYNWGKLFRGNISVVKINAWSYAYGNNSRGDFSQNDILEDQGYNIFKQSKVGKKQELANMPLGRHQKGEFFSYTTSVCCMSASNVS